MNEVTRKAVAGVAAVLVTLALSLSLILFVFAIKPFTLGVWFQSEAPIGLMHVLSGVCGLGVALWGVADKRILSLACHPFVFVPLALATWSFVAGLFHPVPWIGIFGSPEVGEGVLWFLDLAVLTASAIILGRFRVSRIILLVLSFIAVAVISWLTWDWLREQSLAGYGKQTHYVPVPYFFPDYLAFLGGFLILLMVGFAHRMKYRNVLITMAIIVGSTAIYVSQNWAAIGMSGGAVFLWLAFSRMKIRSRFSETNLRRLGAAVAVLTSLAITSLLLLSNIKDLLTQQGLISHLANSILSRSRLFDILVAAIYQEPYRLFAGWGWGSYSSLFATHLPVDWAIILDGGEVAADVAGQHWDAVHRVDFHSHNFLTEAITGAGIPAMLLALAIFAMVPLWSQRRLLPLTVAMVAYTAGVSAFWFMMPICLPFMALAWGALARPVRWRNRKAMSWKLGGGTAVLGASLLFMGLESLAFSLSAYHYLPSMNPPLMVGQDRQPCVRSFDDKGRGGLHLSHRLRVITSSIVKDLKKETDIAEKKISFLRGIFCAAEDYIDRGANFRLLTSSILARADLAFAPTQAAVQPLVDSILVNWGDRLEKALAVAPRRTDLSAPYLLWLLKEKREQEFSRLAFFIFNKNPKDPIGLWFSGIALLEKQASAGEGLGRMRRALELGVERMIPVDEGLKQQILE